MNAAQPPIPPLHYIVSFRWNGPVGLMDWKTPEHGTCHSLNDVFEIIGEHGEEDGGNIRVICADLAENTASDVTADALLALARSYTDDGEPCPWWLLDHADAETQAWGDRAYLSQAYSPASVSL